MSIKICPVSGPYLLTESERKRRAVEIVNSHGANSIERFNQVVALERGQRSASKLRAGCIGA